MAEFFIEVLRYLLAPSLIGAVLAATIWQRREKLFYAWGAFCTLLGAVLGTVVYALKKIYPKRLLRTLTRVNREVLALALVLILLALLAWTLYLFWRRRLPKAAKASETASIFCLGLALAATLVTTLPFVILKAKEFVAFGEDSFGTQSLFRACGYAAGFLILFLLALAIWQNFKRLSEHSAAVFTELFLLAFAAEYFLKGISALARLRILKSSNDLVFAIMILDDRSLNPLAPIYVALTALLAARVYLKHRRLVGTFPTPAARRKERWWLRNCRRWAALASVLILLVYSSLTLLFAYINKPVVLTPPQDFQESKELIIIPLTDVDDGHLHRFSYKVDGHDIRFIVVKKPQGNAYGLGLDACDICGVAGYYERNNDVICKRCDVVMNKATIGFKGGCNPVPFNYDIEDGKIIIKKSVLEAEKNRFPVGD